jgi:hypothetical protein
VYYPLHLQPYTPASRLPRGKTDPAFRTKPQVAEALVDAAVAAGVPFCAIVADCFYGDHEGFVEALDRADRPYVLALKPQKGMWAPAEAAHTPVEAAQALRWDGPKAPGDWTRVVRRRFRDGHEEVWWVAEATLGPWKPDGRHRLVVATTDPSTLPGLTTWYLLTNLPRPGSPPRAASPHAPAELAEVVRLYGLRLWVEQGYKQVKGELGWADFPVRADAAIQRHWHLVSAFAGGPGSRPMRGRRRCPPTGTRHWLPRVLPLPCPLRRGGGKISANQASGEHGRSGPVSWPVTVRQVRGWLAPWHLLGRCWRAWSSQPPPAELQALLDAVGAGRPLCLFLRE